VYVQLLQAPPCYRQLQQLLRSKVTSAPVAAAVVDSMTLLLLPRLCTLWGFAASHRELQQLQLPQRGASSCHKCRQGVVRDLNPEQAKLLQFKHLLLLLPLLLLGTACWLLL
jgi:hypothetical protein